MGEGVLLAGQVMASILLLFANGFLHYLLSTTIAGKPWNPRVMLCHSAVLAVEQFINKALNSSNGSVGVALIAIAVLTYWLYDVRGMKWLSLCIRFLLGLLCMEFGCAALLYGVAQQFNIPDSELFVVSVHDLLRLNVLAVSSLTLCVISPILSLGVILLRKIGRALMSRLPKVKEKRRVIVIYIRMLLLLATGMIMIIMTTDGVAEAMRRGIYKELVMPYLLRIVITCTFLIICLAYLLQDRRYLQQLSRNETLEQQQLTNASLLSNLRSFRHNMVNMLYGFEGAILSGDTANIRDYYREMTEKCALVNNENIVALERVVNPSVSALLLQAIERARKESLPINLYVQHGLRFSRAMADSDLCEVIGVLLDNAIEAAIQADVRYVSVEMRNVDNALETIIKNTYAGEVTEAQLLSGTVSSTKPEHSGYGLHSVREILARNKKAFINMQISGQYVCAQLLVLM